MILVSFETTEICGFAKLERFRSTLFTAEFSRKFAPVLLKSSAKSATRAPSKPVEILVSFISYFAPETSTCGIITLPEISFETSVFSSKLGIFSEPSEIKF